MTFSLSLFTLSTMTFSLSLDSSLETFLSGIETRPDMYLPDYFPLVHPSPLNIGWRKHNPWFESDVIPVLQTIVKEVLS